MSNFGIALDEKKYKIFIIGSRQEEDNLKERIFSKIQIPEDGFSFLFDKKNSWIVCEITCCSSEALNSTHQYIEECLR